MSAIQAATAELADVQFAIDQAVDGDTILIPASSVVWQGGLSYSKAVAIIGQGIGATIIHERLPQNGNLFRLVTQAGKPSRVSAIEFRDGRPESTQAWASGIINLSGDSHLMRLDHCRFDKVKSDAVRFSDGWVRGVADHNEHILLQRGGQAYHMHMPGWGGDRFGDQSWSDPIDWGGPNAWYIEDCRFERADAIGGAPGITDTYGGARFVFRHNTTLNCNLPTHGTGDGAGRNRGLRQFEVYENDFVYDPPSNENLVHIRGGTGVFANNRMVGIRKGITLHYYRYAFDKSPFGFCDGLNAFDKNDPAGVYLSGIAGAGSMNLTLKVPGAGWTPNQWKGYIVRVEQSSQKPDGHFNSIIVSNTADTIKVDPSSRNQTKPFVEGEAFEIRRILLGLDMPGAGTTDLLMDKSSDPTPVDLHQQFDPIYIWGNTGAPNPASNPETIEGVHFHNNVARPGWTPYIYPHPLTQAGGTVPLRPIHLTIS